MSKSKSHSENNNDIDDMDDLSDQFEDMEDENNEGIIDDYSGTDFNEEDEHLEADNNENSENSPEVKSDKNNKKQDNKKSPKEKNTYDINDIKKQFENIDLNDLEEDNINTNKNKNLKSKKELNNSKEESEDYKSYTRDELVFLTKINIRASRYEEAVNYAVEFVKLKPVLSSEERNTVSNAFKSLLLLKRTSLKYLTQVFKLEDQKIQRKEIKENKEKFSQIENNLICIEQILSRVEDEYYALIELMLDIIDNLLLPNSKKEEAQVFYMKLKGDYYRYRAEFQNDNEDSVDLAEKAYNDAYMLSEDSLPITSLTRLGLALNFSIFYYEQKNMIDEAIIIARNCYDEAVKSIDEVDPSKVKDYITLVQIIKENTIFWNTEKADEEM